MLRIFGGVFAAALSALAVCGPAAAAKLEVLHEFTGAEGSDPIGGLTVDPNTGTLYGTATYGGAGYGTVFSLKPPKPGKHKWKFDVLYTFQGGIDGSYPATGLAIDPPTADLYGTTLKGSTFCGDGNCGTIFFLKVFPDGSAGKLTIHNFSGDTVDGTIPNSAPVFEPTSRQLYGTTGSIGGSKGTIYRLPTLNPDTFHVIYNPTNGIGRLVGYPPQGVVFSRDQIYGTAFYGTDSGTIFRFDEEERGRILYGFNGPPDGANPQAPPIMDAEGTLYGTTVAGGNPKACPDSPGCGIIWKKPPSSPLKVLHTFAFFTQRRDGMLPLSPLVLDPTTGTLYGTTYYGGTGTQCGGVAGSCGTIFSVDTLGGNYQVLWEFPRGGPANPQGQLVFYAGELYGTSYDGGQHCPDGHYIGCGTVWKLTP